ncbi:MAG: DUF4864 domain-containing protein [Rhodobacteraceae bacterium]|nr:DUF4864 domain-containing protein [Paracoccaceae bacterium]
MRVILGLVVAAALALGARAQQAGEQPADPAIQAVIQSQIDAFLRDDFETAFTFASPIIKGIFETPERFGKMVREGYPMVWRPSDVQFMDLREEAGRLYQRVVVRDAGGALFALDYQMVETPEGWQINSVQVLRMPEVGA